MSRTMIYTPKQMELLIFIQHFIETKGYAPTYSEIGDHLGVKSVTAWEHLNALIKKGAVGKRKYESRGIYIRDPNYQPVKTIRNKILALIAKGDQEFIKFLLETADGIRERELATSTHTTSVAGNPDN
jgi:SOS-response transcriptional repressor LexA